MTYKATQADRDARKECEKEFEGNFMQPCFYLGADIQDIIMYEGLDCEDDSIYCRLSANGYMDKTDLSGPYTSLKDAANDLIEMYGEG